LHLKLFRPNLENPANKNATKELNEDELKRTAAFQEVSFFKYKYFTYFFIL
jgi:hypothetical protein